MRYSWEKTCRNARLVFTLLERLGELSKTLVWIFLVISG